MLPHYFPVLHQQITTYQLRGKSLANEAELWQALKNIFESKTPDFTARVSYSLRHVLYDDGVFFEDYVYVKFAVNLFLMNNKNQGHFGYLVHLLR